MTTATTTAAAIADRISSEWAQHLVRTTRAPMPHPHVYASAWRKCDRRMALELTHADRQPPWSAEVLAKFRRGDDRERDLLVDLQRIGRDADPPFRILGQQERFQLRDRKSRVAIVGKVDARIEVDDVRAPIEVKAWSQYLVDRVETFEDLFSNPWTESGGYQLLSYLYGAGEPFGFLLLDRSGIPRLIPVDLDANLDRMEAFLTRAERILDHVEGETLPDFLDDPTECQRCPFYGSTCNPPLSANGAAAFLVDPDLEAALERRQQLKSQADEFDKIDRDIKRHLRGVEHAIVGPFHIRGKWGNQSRIELPVDLKKQYTITDPKGRFTLEIVKL